MLDSIDTLIAFVVIMLVVSLLITIAVQMLAAMLNLRGLNLLYGLRNTFSLITPELVQNTTDLARSVLKGKLVSDSFLPDWGIFKLWRHATAIRPDEAFDAIHRIAIGKKAPDNECLRQNAQALLVALGVDRKLLDSTATQILEARQTVSTFQNDAEGILQSVSNKELQTRIQTLVNLATARVAAIGAEAVADAEKAVVAAAASIDAAYQKFHYWTDICQERVQQWFTMHTRIITVAFAIVFAFWLQLDSVDIFRLVSSNRAVRDKLVAQSAAVIAQADKTLGDRKSVLQTSYERWLASLDDTTKAALTKIKVEPAETPERLTARIEAALPTASNKEAIMKSFADTLKKTVDEVSKDLSHEYAGVKADLDNTGFDLFPKDGRGRWGKTWSDGWPPHIWGVLFSAGLLSLGAPFWYNALKNLTSLRSTVAQKISQEQKQAQEHPEQAKAESAPAGILPKPNS